MARKVLTSAEMIAVISAGGSVLINCPTHQILATRVEQVPPDEEILDCFPLIPRLVFDTDDLNANAIGILGKYFSGTPSNNDTIKYNSSQGVWEFVQFGASVIPVTSGGTGLSNISANKLLYSTSNNTLAPIALGSTLSVSASTLSVLNDTSTQKVEIFGNGNLFGSRKAINFINGANTSVSVTDDPTNNKLDVTISASSSAGSRWDQLANPTGNLTLNHGGTNTVFQWGNGTAGNSLLLLRDSNNNTGNGVILDIMTGTASSINPLRATVSGSSNGILMDSTGKLQALGTGKIEANSVKGVTTSGILVRGTSDTFFSRSLVSSNTNHIVVANNDGVLGNPTISLGADVVSGVNSDTNVQASINNNIMSLLWNGTLAKTRQHPSTVYTDQSNTYVAGNKQNFVPNSVNAAINIGAVSGNPSARTNGDLWTDSMTGNIRAMQNGNVYDIVQYICHKKMFAGNNITTGLFEVELLPSTSTAIIVDYAIHSSDGNNVEVRSGSFRFSAINKAGTILKEEYTSSEGVVTSIGTLNADFNIVEGTNKVTLNVLANTSLTPTMFFIKYYIKNLSENNISLL